MKEKERDHGPGCYMYCKDMKTYKGENCDRGVNVNVLRVTCYGVYTHTCSTRCLYVMVMAIFQNMGVHTYT